MNSNKQKFSIQQIFEKFASKVTYWTGKPLTFMLAFGSMLLWAVSGPFFHFSSNWQLIINTGTTIITFMMVFLIQHSQNKDSLSIQLKLNEIVAALNGASNRLINVQDLTEDELQTLHNYYTQLSVISKKDVKLNLSHSVEEATERKADKMKNKKQSIRKINAFFNGRKGNLNLRKLKFRKRFSK